MINKLLKNCLEIKNIDGFYGVRFSRNQYEYLKSLGEKYEIRSLCSPSIPIKFIKIPSIDLIFGFKVLGFARDTVNLDIYVDDLFYKHVDYKDKTNEFKLVFDSKFDNCKIEIYLSNTCIWRINKIEGDYKFLEENYKGSILILGDSISQGMQTYMPSMSYANLIHRFENYKIINQSCGGLCYDYKYLEFCEVQNPDYVIVEFGTNDILFKEDLVNIEINISKFLEILIKKFLNSKIILILPIPILNVSEDKELKIRDILLKNLNEFKNISILDGYEFFPKDKKYYYDGTIHPNEIGNFLIYLKLKEELEV